MVRQYDQSSRRRDSTRLSDTSHTTKKNKSGISLGRTSDRSRTRDHGTPTAIPTALEPTVPTRSKTPDSSHSGRSRSRTHDSPYDPRELPLLPIYDDEEENDRSRSRLDKRQRTEDPQEQPASSSQEPTQQQVRHEHDNDRSRTRIQEESSAPTTTEQPIPPIEDHEQTIEYPNVEDGNTTQEYQDELDSTRDYGNADTTQPFDTIGNALPIDDNDLYVDAAHRNYLH